MNTPVWIKVLFVVGVLAASACLVMAGYAFAQSQQCRDRGGVPVDTACLNPKVILP